MFLAELLNELPDSGVVRYDIKICVRCWIMKVAPLCRRSEAFSHNSHPAANWNGPGGAAENLLCAAL